MRKSFRDLKVWELSHQLVLEIYRGGIKFPPYERFGLESQIKRAAVSIPANIAEGYKRQHDKEFVKFLSIAHGSLGELQYYLLLLHDLGYLEDEYYKKLKNMTDSIDRMLESLIYKIKKNLGLLNTDPKF